MSKIKETDENIRAVKISTNIIRCEHPIIEMLDEVYEELGKQFQDEEKFPTASSHSADEEAPPQDLKNPLIYAGKARKYEAYSVEFNGKVHNIYEFDENSDMFGSDSGELSSLDDANDAPEPGPGLNEEEEQIKRKRNQLQHDTKEDCSEDNESVHSNMSLEEISSPTQFEGRPAKIDKSSSVKKEVNVNQAPDPSLNKDKCESSANEEQSKRELEESKEEKEQTASNS